MVWEVLGLALLLLFISVRKAAYPAKGRECNWAAYEWSEACPGVGRCGECEASARGKTKYGRC